MGGGTCGITNVGTTVGAWIGQVYRDPLHFHGGGLNIIITVWFVIKIMPDVTAAIGGGY